MTRPFQALLFAVAMLLVAPAASAPAAPVQYLETVDDMPLMPGLEETSDSLSFDKPDGRIVRAVASGDVGVSEVRGFYAETLPQLGWTEAPGAGGALVFYRDRERLEIFITRDRPDAPTLVRFSIEPN